MTAVPAAAAFLAGRRRQAGEFLRFACVGASGYAVNLAVFATATAAGGGHRVAAALAFLVAVTSNFALNRSWTFRAARGGSAAGAAGRFLVVSGAAFAVSLVLLDVAVRAGAPPVAGQAAAVLLVTPLSYLGNRRWTFGRSA
jgi:putative flippase GtrA